MLCRGARAGVAIGAGVAAGAMAIASGFLVPTFLSLGNSTSSLKRAGGTESFAELPAFLYLVERETIERQRQSDRQTDRQTDKVKNKIRYKCGLLRTANVKVLRRSQSRVSEAEEPRDGEERRLLSIDDGG